MIAGYERPTHGSRCARRARPARPATGRRTSTTTRCSTSLFQHRASSRDRDQLTLHTGGVERAQGKATGIHWHVDQNVEFVSPDPQKRIDSLGPDQAARRQVVTYFDAASQALQGRHRQAAEAADGVPRLPQRSRPPVPQPGRRRRRGDRHRADRPQPALRQGAGDGIIDAVGELHGPWTSGREGREVIAAAAPSSRPRPRTREASRSSRRR